MSPERQGRRDVGLMASGVCIRSNVADIGILVFSFSLCLAQLAIFNELTTNQAFYFAS